MSVKAELKGPVAWLTLARPEALNALSPDMVEEMIRALRAWRDDLAVRVVAITGTGRAFSSGADLKRSRAPEAPGQPDFLDILTVFFDLLREYPKPVIAAVNGITLAGGMETVLACDFVIAAKSARFGDGHANFGVFPGGGGAAILPRKIPNNIAKYLLFTGDMLPADDMKTYGLVSEVVADEDLLARVQTIAEKLAQKSPEVLRRMKKVANEAADKSIADALRHEMLELRNQKRSYDYQEGLQAFKEKRQPVFKGY